MLSRDEILARSIRLHPELPVNPYTGTLNDPFQEAQSRYMGPGWDQFFGGLQKTEEDAQNAGMRYRMDWGGFGNGVSEGASMPRRRAVGVLPGADYSAAVADGSGGLQYPSDRGANELNAALAEEADLNGLRQGAKSAAVDVQRQSAIDAMRQSYADQVNASLNAPPITDRIVKRVDPNGKDGNLVYSTEPQSTDPRQQFLDRLPPPQRLHYEAQQAAIDMQKQSLGLKQQREERLATGGGAAGPNKDDVSLAVQAMKEGQVPPQLPGRASKDYTAILAEAKRQGYDLASAATDWTATQKHIASLNGAQQLRLNQSVNALPEMLDSVESLAKEWKGGRYPALNAASLQLAKQGAFGQKAASIATRLDSQIADVTADLGNVYMGGNSPTDHALELAGKNLKGQWSEQVLLDNIDMARKNVQIRQNSIRHTGVAGASANNPYATQGAAAAPGGMITVVDPGGGKHYFSDAAKADAFKKAAGIQ